MMTYISMKNFVCRRSFSIFTVVAICCVLAVWAEQRGYLRKEKGRDVFESLRKRWERSTTSQSLKRHFNTKRERGAAPKDEIQGTPEDDFLPGGEGADIVSQVTDGESSAKSGKPLCVFYDRPPRTGSTTTSKALHSCFKNWKGYKSLPWMGSRSRHRYIPEMVKRAGLWTTAVKRHLYLTADSEQLLKQSCSDVFYVSSTRSMRKRLLSAIKFEVVETDGNGNGTAEVEHVEDCLRRRAVKRKDGLSWIQKAEVFLESHPYVNPDDRTSLLVPEEKRMTPDYVIRSEYFYEDLSELLSTLGCSETFTSTNVHKSKGTKSDADETRLLSMLDLEYGDYRWKKLRRLGDVGNEAGLKKAAMLAKKLNAG